MSWIVSWDAEVRYWRWSAAKERPIVPAPTSVMRLDSSLGALALCSIDMMLDRLFMKDA